MDRLTPELLQIVKLYYENQRSMKQVFRALRATYGRNNRPSERTIAKMIQKFQTQFLSLDDRRPNRQRPALCQGNVAAVADSVREDREQSIRRQVGLSCATTRRILRKDLGLKAYKIQLVEELKPQDLPKHRVFSIWALEKSHEDPLFHRKILFSDEAHFWLNGYVNKQTCWICGDTQPDIIQ
ncbi:hypothetical protein JTB14_037511 [Gonioctena quinquepunctata]|nr:hypothetical protein JTB14_037511 [Gonioctena quinquepunctata]